MPMMAMTMNSSINEKALLERCWALGVFIYQVNRYTPSLAPRPRAKRLSANCILSHGLVSKPGTIGLMARLLYGTGMRLMECVRLRVKDLLFEENQILVRDGKGFKDRVTMLPSSVKAELAAHLERVKLLHKSDLAAGAGEVYLPYALARKYPQAAREWERQSVFPASHLSPDPRSGKMRRHHASETSLQRAV